MGDMPQKKRLKVIDDIKAGKLHLLVATDVAARGLDIEDLAMVVNYDLPNESENYVHRIGRTARAGKTGKAVNLASEQDVYALPGIERYIGRKIPCETAVPELFAEDKSEGKRIHTEFYEDRGGHRADDHSRHRSGGGINAGGKKHDAGRHSRKDRHGPTVEQKRGEKKNRVGDQGRHSQNQMRDFQKGVKLSELSLEERMAYYREKYDKSAAAGGSKTADGITKKAALAAEPAGRSSPPVHRKPKAPFNRKQKKHKPDKPQQSAENTSVSQPAAVDQKTPKKGILARLFGALKK
jgi:ATP-dependent RNA helicase RhlB